MIQSIFGLLFTVYFSPGIVLLLFTMTMKQELYDHTAKQFHIHSQKSNHDDHAEVFKFINSVRLSCLKIGRAKENYVSVFVVCCQSKMANIASVSLFSQEVILFSYVITGVGSEEALTIGFHQACIHCSSKYLSCNFGPSKAGYHNIQQVDTFWLRRIKNKQTKQKTRQDKNTECHRESFCYVD